MGGRGGDEGRGRGGGSGGGGDGAAPLGCGAAGTGGDGLLRPGDALCSARPVQGQRTARAERTPRVILWSGVCGRGEEARAQRRKRRKTRNVVIRCFMIIVLRTV